VPPPSAKLVLRTQKTRPDGCAPVYLRVTHARRSRFVASGVWVTPKDWNADKGKVRASHPMAQPFNAKLADLLHKAQGAALRATSAEAVVAGLDSSGSFTDYLDGFVRTLEARGLYYRAQKFRTLRRKLTDALGCPLTWGMLDRVALVRFERECRVRWGNNPNTIRKDVALLRRVVNQATREGALPPDADPFRGYDPPKAAPVNRRRLTPDEVGKLAALDLPAGSRLRVVRDAFLVAFYGSGVRIADVLMLRPENVEREGDGARLVYRMQKSRKAMAPKLPARALAVLAPYLEAGRRGRYLFPLLQPGDDRDAVELRKRQARATTKANTTLRRLGELAGIGGEGLTTHVARHSWADAARKVGDLYAVSKGLGHSGLRVTEHYLADFDRTAVDALTDSLWSA
jgi:integrase/recombinase XerD